MRWFQCPSQIEKTATTPLFKFNLEYIFSEFFCCCSFSFIVYVCAWVYVLLYADVCTQSSCTCVEGKGRHCVSFLCILCYLSVPSSFETRSQTLKLGWQLANPATMSPACTVWGVTFVTWTHLVFNKVLKIQFQVLILGQHTLIYWAIYSALIYQVLNLFQTLICVCSYKKKKGPMRSSFSEIKHSKQDHCRQWKFPWR